MIDVLVQPPDEIGWQSFRTASAWGPTYRVEDPCGWCWTNPGILHREATEEEAALGILLAPYPCPNCGGIGAYAELVGPPPQWIYE